MSSGTEAGVGPGKQADKLRGLSAPAATNFKSDNDKAAAMRRKDLTVNPLLGSPSRTKRGFLGAALVNPRVAA